MFSLLKALFYTFLAVVVGVFIGTVPVDGKTIGARIADLYNSEPVKTDPGKRTRTAATKPAARSAPKASKAAPKVARTRGAVAPAQPVTAGMANSPDLHTNDDRAALDQIIAQKSGAR